MKERRLAFWTAMGLCVAGAACLWGRMRAMEGTGVQRGDSVWTVTYEVVFRAAEAGAQVRAGLPENSKSVRIFGESFSHPGLVMDVLRSRQTGRREAVAVSGGVLEAGRFQAEFEIHVHSEGAASEPPVREELSTGVREHYLRTEKMRPEAQAVVGRVLKGVGREKVVKTDVLKRIFTYCTETIGRNEEAGDADAGRVLAEGSGSTLGRARAMVALCRAARFPARLAAGLVLRESESAQPHVWVQVYSGSEWLSYDPENGYAGELPARYLPLREDGTEIVRVSNAEGVETRFSVQRLGVYTGRAEDEGRWVGLLDLRRLPPGMQRTLASLLLLPIGALITAVFRNVIGVQTFGTFAPTLLALSFVRSDLRTGLVLFVVVLGVGLGVRAFLNRLKLLAVARLGIVLTLVVGLTTLAVSGLAYFGLTPSAHAVLLPMVILTMMIERFYIIAEEDGRWYAGELLAGTLGVGACCLPVFRWERLGRIVLAYPEVHFFTVGALILIGCYAGFRVSELWRFRDLAGPGGEERG